MKYSMTAVIGIFSMLLFCNFQTQPITSEDPYIEVYFSKKLTISDLTKIQSDLSAKSIKLNYDYLRFTSTGKLTELEYHVSTEKFGATDMSKNLDVEIGFIINTTPNAKFGITAGTKDQIQQRLKEFN